MKIKSLYNALLFFVIFLSGIVQTQAQKPNRSKSVAIDFDSYYNKKNEVIIDTVRGSVGRPAVSVFDRLNPDSSVYHLLIICNQNYKDKEWSSLKWPVHDGNEIKRVLTSRYSFEEQNVTFLTDPTRAEIYNSLLGLTRKLKENDNLIIFYAGHGVYDLAMNMGYWIPSDGEANNSSNWIANDEIKRILKVMKTQHVLVIADACFAGTLTRSGASGGLTNTTVDWNQMLPVNMLRNRYSLKSRKVITSGSLEQVPDKSFFLESLVNTLETSNLKYLVSEQLFDRVKRSIEQQTPLMSVIPECGNELGSDFIFRLKD